MNLKAYLSFVELPTKIASVIPFMIGTIYTYYRYGEINLQNILIMFISMLSFDMATTAINNYCDYKSELKHYKDNYKGKNPIFVYGISQKIALITIATLLLIATILGIILTLKTNLLVLAIGVLCFFVGIFYTFGPIPISRMPLGEVFSGIFMGLLIPFLTVYISIYNKEYFGIYIESTDLLIKFNVNELLIIGSISIPLIGGIANIMLANNICDLENDMKVERYTLPYYIGKNVAIKLFKYIYYIGYITILASMIMGILPKTCILVILTLYFVQQNIKLFEKEQIKSKTFVIAVKNFSLIGVTYIISILISLL